MRRLVLLVAACGSGAEPTTASPQPTARSKPSLAPITGAHGGAIIALAVTPDGKAAATADTTGGLRLWPTLDGTREPIVIEAPVPFALAIAHEGAGFAIAVTDAANQVELIRADTKGRVRERRRLGEANQIEVVGDGLLALRADQVIEHVALDGTLRGRLPAVAGTQILSLVVTDRTAKAVVADETTKRVAPIDLDAMTWGAASPPLELAELAPITLTPDGKYVLAVSPKTMRITRYDLATGNALAVCPVPSNVNFPHRRFHGDFEGFGLDVEPHAITMLGSKVACFVNNTFTWWNVDDGSSQTAQLGNALAQPVFAATPDRVVFASEMQLGIQTPEDTKFLGYGFRALAHVRPVPTGLLIGKGDQEPVLLDESFKERARFALPKLRVDWTDLLPIDERFVLTSSTRPGTGDVWGNDYQLGIYDIVKQAMHHMLPHRARGGDLVYEPSTRILVVTDKTRSLLMRFDPKTHTLGDEVVLDLADPPRKIALLDPKLSGGIIALAIRDEGDGGIQVFEFHARDWPAASEHAGQRTIKPRSTYRNAGEVRAIDRAGRLYLYDLMYTIGIYQGGAIKAVIDNAPSAKLRPSPDGKKLWSTAAWGSSDVDWMWQADRADVLYARFPHALARIDVATGALAERQCGWGFGISSTARDASTSAPSVCDVAP